MVSSEACMNQCKNIYYSLLVSLHTMDGKAEKQEIRVNIMDMKKEASCSPFLHNFLTHPFKFEK